MWITPSLLNTRERNGTPLSCSRSRSRVRIESFYVHKRSSVENHSSVENSLAFFHNNKFLLPVYCHDDRRMFGFRACPCPSCLSDQWENCLNHHSNSQRANQCPSDCSSLLVSISLLSWFTAFQLSPFGKSPLMSDVNNDSRYRTHTHSGLAGFFCLTFS